MESFVCMGAVCKCSFGTAPSTFVVTPENKIIAAVKPVATIMDNVPLRNIMPFGMCSSLANPAVASATAAALGALTPMPCIPVTASPWMPGEMTVLIGNKPVLTGKDKLMCAYGGVIEISNSGVQKLTTS